MNHMRIETDLLGDVAVPAKAWYGAQTQRAIENFPLNGSRTIGDFPALIRALVMIKQAAAETNGEIKAITPKQKEAIVFACQQLLADGMLNQFQVHFLHGGGGTSANMNANEVIANLGEEYLGGKRGAYVHLHPNDHVNLHQSTNDVYPTACHLAVILQWGQLKPIFNRLTGQLRAKAAEYETQKRIARTCLQDAVDITYGEFLGGYVSLIERCVARIDHAVQELYAVSLGGSIIGRERDVPAGYFQAILPNLNAIFPGGGIKRTSNLFDGFQNLDDLANVSAQLDTCSRALIKIGKDLRLLASGPEAGLGEIALPAVQPGSSIMPGKINPVMPEFLIQVCFRVVGNHAMGAKAVDHGELDLNVWESPLVFGILESMALLESAVAPFTERCLTGLSVPAAINDQKAGSIIALLAELMKQHGYSTISNICKKAKGDFDQIRFLFKEEGYLSKDGEVNCSID